MQTAMSMKNAVQAQSKVARVPARSSNARMARAVRNIECAAFSSASALSTSAAKLSAAASTAVRKPVSRGSRLAVSATAAPLDIIFVSAEVAPWSKTGGLGDVVSGLPIELAKRGHNVITISPRYDQYAEAWDTNVVVDIDGEPVRFFHAVQKGVHRVFVDHPCFLAKVWGKTGAKLYGPRSGADFVDNQQRFRLFNKAAIEAARALPFGPGEKALFVANDWHSALVPVLLKDVYQPKGEFTESKSAFCIHNIAFQGRFWRESWPDLGLPDSALAKFDFEDGYGRIFSEVDPLDDDRKSKEAIVGGSFAKVNWMKAGILSADKVLTVSPNYASEITSGAEKGVELHEFLSAAGVEGIVNGMDITEWDPSKDKFLDTNYDKTTVEAGKAANKEALQAELGLPVDPTVPLFGFIGRLEEQKGVDILLKAVEKAAATGVNAQFAILGTGKAQYEKATKALSTAGAGKVKAVVKFSAPLAHTITAGADYILVPSRFEPCGLIQLHAMRYGTVPVVASTGGLVDTVKEGVTGFHIGELDPDNLEEADVEAVVETITRASQVYTTPTYKVMSKNCISQDLSWSKPATKWEGILEELAYGAPSGTEKKQSITTPVQTKVPALA